MTVAVAVPCSATDCGNGGGAEPIIFVFRVVEDGLLGLPGTKFGPAATCEAVPAGINVVVVAACVTFTGD